MPWGVAALAVAGVASAAIGSAMAPKAPAAADYSGVAAADAQSAQLSAQTSQNQLDWAKQQYADQAPYTKAYLQSMTDSSNEQLANAQKDRARYESVYQPVEDQFVQQATGWNSAARSNQNAGAAMGEVANTFDQQRAAAQKQLESFGLDPSQTRFAALDLGTRVAQASAQAAAGTQSRLNTEATGLSLEGEAINIGKGYPGQVAQSYAGATQAGQAGVNSALNTSSTYGNLMGSPTSWAANANTALGNQAGALAAGDKATQQSWSNSYTANQNSQAQYGKLIGGALQASGY